MVQMANKLCIDLFAGKAAVEAKNLFYYLTYAGSVNLESLDDATLKKVAKFFADF